MCDAMCGGSRDLLDRRCGGRGVRWHVWGGRATCSIAYSLPATSHTLVTASSDCGVSSRFSSFSFVKVNSSFGHTWRDVGNVGCETHGVT